MAQSDAEQEAELAKRKRIRRLRNLIIFVPLSTILVLLITCIFLGISLYITKKELQEAKSAIAAAGGTQTVSVDNTQASGDPLLYTTIGVDEFERTGIDGEDQSEEDTNVRKVYLTFDDGPSSNTNRILDILAEYDVKATFFVVGKEEEEYQALYKRIVDEGHTLAMHSYSHKYNEIYQSLESYSADLSKLQEFLYDTTGVWCRYCRFPGGSSNTVSRVDMHELIAYLDEQDMSYFDWNISSGDAMSSSLSPEEIIRNCTAKLKNYDEAIILMHDAAEKNSTVRALPELIETIQSMEDTKILPITDDTERIHHISND
ncbi:MAG: polysaccharide deacetylase [Lachnospiraceae bacterium]|nr:polysaccharide deacetylase [Lachnospiraceae bacterium]